MTHRRLVAAVAAGLALELGGAAALVVVRSLPVQGDRSDFVGVTAPAYQQRQVGLPRLTEPRLRIPSLGVEAPVVSLGLTRNGALQVPRTAGSAGLWSDGPLPGDPGAAVLVGHADLDGEAGVFQRVRDLEVDDRIEVLRPDGRRAVFVIERVERHDKGAFPTEDVYAPTADPSLRLVTCGGAFDRRTGHYRDNVVAYARAA